MNKERQRILDNVWVRVILIGISSIIFLFLCYVLRGPLISLLLAFIVAYIFDPVVDFVEHKTCRFLHKSIRRVLVIFVLIVGILMITAGFLAYAVPRTVNGIYHVGSIIKEQYPGYLNVVEKWVEKYGNRDIARLVKPVLEEQIEKTEHTDIEKLSKQELFEKAEPKDTKQRKEQEPSPVQKEKPKSEVQLQKRIAEAIWNLKKYLPQAMDFLAGAIKSIFYGTFGFFSIAVNFIIFSVVSIYLLKDFDVIMRKMKNLIPLSKREHIINLVLKVNHNLRYYLRGQLIVCFALSIIYSIGLSIAGIDLSILIGFIGGFGNLIPYVGTGIGIILASLLALFEFHDFQHIFYVIITFVVGQSLEATVITPRVVGKELSIHPAMVILSILIFGQLWGFLGLLLAVPIAATLKVFIDEFVSRYKSSKYYTG